MASTPARQLKNGPRLVDAPPVRAEKPARNPEEKVQKTGTMDRPLLLLIFLLVGLGLLCLFSASYATAYDSKDGNSTFYIFRQAIFAVGGSAAMLVLSRRNYHKLHYLAIPSLILAVAVMATIKVPGLKNMWVTINQATRWIKIPLAGTFQPSELVKACYIFVGASTLDRLFSRRNLYGFIGFSAVCVMALALIGDFGTALVFFVTFLVISYMRSGSFATVFLAVSGAGLAGFLAVTVKPYIAQRFATWGHAWEDVYGAGFQQTRAMSAAASGGLTGKGAGFGWLDDIFAANTDMVFAVVCEELGLIIGLCMVAAVLVMAFFAVRSARHGRSAYYPIAACAAMALLLTQMALNVFGSLDLLPFTGVTFPFVSKGGTSLISCWLLMAFIKSADNRRGSSFAVSTARRTGCREEEEEEEESQEEAPEQEMDIAQGNPYISRQEDWYEEDH